MRATWSARCVSVCAATDRVPPPPPAALGAPPTCSPLSQELAALKPGESVYKLMGPMLVRQEQADARAVVDGRLEFLEKEL